MNLADIKRLADKAGIHSLKYHVLSMPIEKQHEIAKKRGYDNFEKFVTDQINEFVARQNEPDDSITLKEYLDKQPLEKRYAAAGWCGRVYMDNAGQQEVLKEAGYSAKEIEEIIQADENNQIPA